jgi:hypothetical protein
MVKSRSFYPPKLCKITDLGLVQRCLLACTAGFFASWQASVAQPHLQPSRPSPGGKRASGSFSLHGTSSHAIREPWKIPRLKADRNGRHLLRAAAGYFLLGRGLFPDVGRRCACRALSPRSPFLFCRYHAVQSRGARVRRLPAGMDVLDQDDHTWVGPYRETPAGHRVDICT